MNAALKAALAALFLFVPLSAQAATMEEIFALYARGDYEQAARLGEASHAAPGLAIAARAVLAEEVLRDTPCLSCLERAEPWRVRQWRPIRISRLAKSGWRWRWVMRRASPARSRRG